MSDLRVCVYQHVCLSSTLKRPKTLPREKSNLSTLRLKILRYLVWTIENGGFQKRAQKMSHTVGPVCISGRSFVDYTSRKCIITRIEVSSMV